MCKELKTLETECQQLKNRMDEAEEKSSKVRSLSKAIQTEERPLLVSALCFVLAVLFFEFQVIYLHFGIYDLVLSLVTYFFLLYFEMFICMFILWNNSLHVSQPAMYKQHLLSSLGMNRC